jgi:pyruvate/2-oxoglutarate dehydrogenase complex dihydrolipoamide dehydrogenase (E3) component
MDYVRSVRNKIYEEEEPAVWEKKGIRILIGNPKFLDQQRLQLGEETVSARKFIIATGSSPFVPPIEGIGDVPYLTNETLFDLETLPRSMTILGGGPIGTELSSAFNRLGVEVTVVEMGDRILVREEPELVTVLTDHLKSEGLKILTGTKAVKFGKENDKIVTTVEDKSDPASSVKSDAILVAVGQSPNVSGLDLEKAGVEYTPKGIVTNRHLQSTAKNIYACGDVAGSYQFSHVAEYQANIAVMNAVLPLPIKKKVDYSNVVWATFTDPELAHAGINEDEARKLHGDKIRVYRHPYTSIDRARTDNSEIGMSKIICHKNGKILGVHILGERAADLLHELQLAKSLKIGFHKIGPIIHVYPTYSDAVKRPSNMYYADRLRENAFLKLLRKLF